MKMRIGTLAILALATRAHGALTFSFNYTDVNTGFNDPVLGADRRNALSAAVSTLSSWYPSYNTTLSVTVSSFSDVGNLNLASASSPFGATVNGFKNNVVRSKVVLGNDINGASADASIQFNFGHAWNLGDTDDPGSYDFKSVTLHELTHAMGFASYIESNGTGSNTSAPALGQPDVWSIFDQFIATADGKDLITTDFRYDTSIPVSALTANPGLYFEGANAVAAYGGLVPLYTPTTFSAGSSISHLDPTALAGLGPLLMFPAYTTGLGPRSLSAVEQGIMMDLGYAVVPEPELAAVATGALALSWGALRRRVAKPGSQNG